MGVRGLFADDAFAALDVCGTMDNDGALQTRGVPLDKMSEPVYVFGPLMNGAC